MANPIETAKGCLVSIAEKTKPVRDYSGSLVNRTTGISAWIEAMSRPTHETHSYEGRPPWIRAINQALDHAAPAYAALGVLAPATSRLFRSLVENPEKFGASWPGTPFATMSADLILLESTIWLSHNPLEFVALKLATNATVHIGLDIAGAAVNRFRNHHSNNTTLAV